ncbi:putative tetratricopeptide repeat protein 39C-like [Apostichopus japonicus]|uniref:Putative tetratricopeptide repeat protein 39C-like n=2 Tax=Stichopus japonicus TaxID=307972 RepID=A0A2G8LA61_STIJA|nr:putative tetratricopeptide repeat protein 39C-like [Apostichopus japonicus]
MPPSVLKVVNLLGFCGDRQFGLTCIKQASHSKDMKAPLAILTLLWYHTVVRPFFGLQVSTKEDCVREALIILEENKPKYPNSALMSFYRGRVLKLQGKLDEALDRYNIALEECSQQREIQLICLYEIGWGNLMKMNWEESLLAFARLKEESKWSQSYYTFLTAMTQGALGQVETSQEIFLEVPTLAKKRTNQLEQYVTKKALRFKKKPPTQTESVLIAIEVLYLWKALPECSEETLISMLKECEKAESDKDKKPIVTLLKGAIHRDLGNKNVAKQFFEGVLKLQPSKPSKTQDMHAFPYACFELGSLMLDDEATAAAGKMYILKAKEEYKDFDFEQRLHVRVHATLQQIRNT